LIGGFIVNKFRGDPALFEEGYRLIAQKTGWRGFGVLPFFQDAARLPAEDAQDLPQSGKGGAGFPSDFSTQEKSGNALHIAALAFSRIANFDDLDPIAQEPGVRFTLVRAGEAIPGDCTLVILPGSKSTRGDLAFLRAQGWDIDLAAHLRRGGPVLGLCGGYQMLGRAIHDPEGLEGAAGSTEGLGLLDIETLMTPEKRLARVEGHHVSTGLPLAGYEIHIGRSEGPGRARPFARLAGQDEGAVSADGRVMGTYLHGVFAADAFRAAFLASLGGRCDATGYTAGVEATLDALAAHIEAHLDVAGLLALAR
jgi:adenosylcobyric acid synthase